ncbi:hypothetical protein, partial [Pseudomonas cyclaminis]|uniref:hypothetical protein n=1 Tax=Pseudomonas cyclaminis TaxID=2781239 RepID=UPI0019D51025
QRVRQMGFDGRLQQAIRSSLLTQGVRVCHVVSGPIGSLSDEISQWREWCPISHSKAINY